MKSRLRVLLSRIHSLFSIRHLDSDFAEELDSHLALLTEENLRRGMSPAEAQRNARLKLGNPAQLRESHHDQRTLSWLEPLAQDIRFALRMLRKNPGFTAVAILILALGIGANTAIFSFAYGILLKPLPYENSSRIVQVWSNGRYGRVVYTSSENIRAIEDRAHSFTQFATYVEGGSNLIADDGPESLQVMFVSGNFFTVLGARPLLGRPILPEDDQPGHDRVAVITYGLWQSHFGADPQILGRQISLVTTPSNAFTAARSPKPYTVIGVMPPVFPFPNRGEILLPIGSWNVSPSAILIARLNEGASLSKANAELQTIAAGLAADNPKTNKNLGLSVTTFRDRITKNSSTGLLILLSSVSFLLLLACVNVGNLLIARSWGRQREIAIRETLGATRPRLLHQFLTESVLLALFGGALGLVIASWSKNLLLAIAPGGTPRIDEIALNWPVLAYTLGLSLLAGILLGVAPAILVSRASPLTGIKQTPASGLATFSSHRPVSLRNALIAAEIALAFLLVTSSALAARSFLRLVNVNMGFSPTHVLRGCDEIAA